MSECTYVPMSDYTCIMFGKKNLGYFTWKRAYVIARGEHGFC
jgi:hypothetical protein